MLREQGCSQTLATGLSDRLDGARTPEGGSVRIALLSTSDTDSAPQLLAAVH